MAAKTLDVKRLDSHLSRTPDGQLLIEDVAVTDLARRFGTPLHVISETRLRENLRRIRNAFAARWLAGVNVYFANKSNPALAVRRVLASEAAGGDCNGLHELQAALMGGTPPERLVLNGNNKDDEAIQLAVRLGARVNVDDLEEIDRVAAVARSLGATAALGIRVKPELSALGDRRSEMFDVTVRDYRDMTKWGLEPEAAEVAVRHAQELSGVELTGLHYHLGRHLAEPALYELVAPGLGSLAGRLRDATGWAPSFLAIGGGFTQGRDPFFRKPSPGERWPRAEDSFVPPIEDYAEAFCSALGRELADREIAPPVLLLEPGRYVTASAGVTLTRVGTVKQAPSRTWVMVDTCVTQIGMSRSPRDAHAIVVADGERSEDPVTCDVVGPLCVPDIMMEQGELPSVARGSLLAILDTGAYADGEASNANSLGRPAVVLVADDRAEIVRRRETFEDIFGRDTIPGRLVGEDSAVLWHAAESPTRD